MNNTFTPVVRLSEPVAGACGVGYPVALYHLKKSAGISSARVRLSMARSQASITAGPALS
ncbi:hypothetical protein WJ971_24420 [Achromobacter xylosoxidans]